MIAAQLAERLGGKREGSSYRCPCPVHGGGSLMVSERDGKMLVQCMAGCAQDVLIGALKAQGLWSTDPIPFTQQEELIEEYDYGLAVKGRFRPKTFRWRRTGDNDWKGLRGLKERDLPLYRIGEVTDGSVIVCEGEKAVNACWQAGLQAVCPPGGASAKDFGDQLGSLQGWEVILWPDNDHAGRSLMRRIEALLNDCTIRWIEVEGQAGADAYDYFERGGTTEGLRPTSSEPRIEPIANGYAVVLPEGGGFVRFEFEELEFGRNRALEASVTVTQDIPGSARRRFWERLSLASGSGRETFRRGLDSIFGDFDWAAKLSTACEMVRAVWRERDPSILLVDAAEVDCDYLLEPFVLSDGPSCIFGMGGTGKTTLALAIALCVSLGLPFIGSSVKPAAVLYVDYEWTERRLKRRLDRLIAGMAVGPCVPPIFYWPGQGIGLAEQKEAIKAKVQRDRIGLIIADSVGYACGGDPLSQERATTYWNALAWIGVPSLSVAHNTKDDDTRFPLGAIYWHNGARISWNVQYAKEAHGLASLGLFNRKANDDEALEPVGLEIGYGEDSIALRRLARLPLAFEAERSQPVRIREALAGGRMSTKDLSEALGLPSNHVRSVAARMRDVAPAGRAEDGSQLWELRYGS